MKTNKIESAVQEWVFTLPFTQQGVLLVALRGPDGLPKDTPVKPLIHFMRGAILNPAMPHYDPNNLGHPDGFMRGDYHASFADVAAGFLYDLDQYPFHFMMHVLHAVEILGYKYPDGLKRNFWNILYADICRRMHVLPEPEERMDERLKF